MFFWDEEKRRRPFGIVTKRIEWLKAAGDSGNKVLVKYLADGKVPARMPRSQCRVCKRPLTWGSRTYDFDHKELLPGLQKLPWWSYKDKGS